MLGILCQRASTILASNAQAHRPIVTLARSERGRDHEVFPVRACKLCRRRIRLLPLGTLDGRLLHPRSSTGMSRHTVAVRDQVENYRPIVRWRGAQPRT